MKRHGEVDGNTMQHERELNSISLFSSKPQWASAALLFVRAISPPFTLTSSQVCAPSLWPSALWRSVPFLVWKQRKQAGTRWSLCVSGFSFFCCCCCFCRCCCCQAAQWKEMKSCCVWENRVDPKLKRRSVDVIVVVHCEVKKFKACFHWLISHTLNFIFQSLWGFIVNCN